MSEIAEGSGGGPSVDPRDVGKPVLFRAFQEEEQSLGGWWVATLVTLPVVVALAAWILARGEQGVTEVVTTTGIRRVYEGMTLAQVGEVLGQPIIVERSADGRTECYQYGEPKLVEPYFFVNEICYREGKVVEVRQRRYSTWRVGEDGAFIPPGSDMPKEQAPARPQEPQAPQVPGTPQAPPSP